MDGCESSIHDVSCGFSITEDELCIIMDMERGSQLYAARVERKLGSPGCPSVGGASNGLL